MPTGHLVKFLIFFFTMGLHKVAFCSSIFVSLYGKRLQVVDKCCHMEKESSGSKVDFDQECHLKE